MCVSVWVSVCVCEGVVEQSIYTSQQCSEPLTSIIHEDIRATRILLLHTVIHVLNLVGVTEVGAMVMKHTSRITCNGV